MSHRPARRAAGPDALPLLSLCCPFVGTDNHLRWASGPVQQVYATAARLCPLRVSLYLCEILFLFAPPLSGGGWEGGLTHRPHIAHASLTHRPHIAHTSLTHRSHIASLAATCIAGTSSTTPTMLRVADTALVPLPLPPLLAPRTGSGPGLSAWRAAARAASPAVPTTPSESLGLSSAHTSKRQGSQVSWQDKSALLWPAT